LRSLSRSAGRRPGDVDAAWLTAVLEASSRAHASKIHIACRLLNRYAGHGEVAELLPKLPLVLRDRRTSAPRLAAGASTELERLIGLQGASASAQRAHRIAVLALVDATGSTPTTDAELHDLLSRDLDGVDWAHRTSQANRYRSALRSLRVIAELARHPDWLALQKAVVDAGIMPRRNPVPYLFRVMEGASLDALTPAWLRSRERAFRSMELNPPYGRADLALTLVENAARLDALHAISSLHDSGLLPPPLITKG
jgi:hypothetical protein